MNVRYGLKNYPKVIAEIGPGDSLGTGVGAMISGVEIYYAFDVVQYANTVRNVQIFEELVDLFRHREDIPNEDEFPEVLPRLSDYRFPSDILSDQWLEKALQPERIDSIRKAVLSLKQNDNRGRISYVVPWYETRVIADSSVDFIFSQAVLEHVDDLSSTYRALCRWLKPGCFMSHVIDFRSHNITKPWNGHWSYSSRLWKLVRGKRPYLINRQPHSVHLAHLEQCRFDVVCDARISDTSGISRKELASEFKYISDEDLTLSLAFLIALKK
jgi:hypothetical protein